MAIEPIRYTGPTSDYVPAPANNQAGISAHPQNTATYREGYHDMDYLNQILNYLIQTSGDIYNQCESTLTNYSLIIDQTDTNLVSAHAQAYPATSVPSYITFQEYKYLLKNSSSNAAQYVMNAYETSIRSASGSNAFDISTIMLTISNESKRIKEFIDGYIGAVDDTSEFRIIENFQNWAEDAKGYVTQFRQALQGQLSAQIPQSEVDTVSEGAAAQLQAVFQVKLNVAASSIKAVMGQLLKNWENVSDDFYSKHLGPALQFQLKVGRNLVNTFDINTYPVISRTVNAAVSGLDSNFATTLADQIKRNQMYSGYLDQIQANIAARDTNAKQIDQLSQKGKYPKQIFTHEGLADQAPILYQVDHPLTDFTPTINYDDNFSPSHSDLSGVEDDNAHAQYVLRSGGEDSTITGEIVFADGGKIDGIVPHLHKHTGTDGSAKLPASSIDFSAFSDNDIDTTSATTSIPKDLIVGNQISTISPIGATTIQLQVQFDMEFIDNVSGYEFEITELS